MEQLGCIYITPARVQIHDKIVVAYSHFGRVQAAQNAVWKYKKLYGEFSFFPNGIAVPK